jgi:hypothetical protein
MPIFTGIGNIVGGIMGAGTARGVANTIAGTGANAGQAIETTGAGAATQTTNAANQGVAGINSATTTGQANVNAATGQANQVASGLEQQQLQNANPYMQEGNQGTSNLAGLAANGGFQAPTAAQAAATPGYQFQLQQGLQGVEQQLGASGGAATGGALKALTQYGQNVASTNYQNVFNNALQGYNTNVNTNLAMAGQGLQGTGLAQNAIQNYGNISNQNTMGSQYFNANLGMQGATSAGQLGLQGAETAGNQNLQGAIAGGNMYMQGAEGAGAARMGEASAVNQAIAGGSSLLGGIASGGLSQISKQFSNMFSPSSNTSYV